jgi:hypothetical protein
MGNLREVSIGCFYPRCQQTITRSVAKGRKMSDAHEELHGIAGKAGWVIGLDAEGQAHYGCECHGPALYEVSPLSDFRTKFRQLFRRALVPAGDGQGSGE